MKTNPIVMELASLAASLATDDQKLIMSAGAVMEDKRAENVARALIKSAGILLGAADEFVENAKNGKP